MAKKLPISDTAESLAFNLKNTDELLAKWAKKPADAGISILRTHREELLGRIARLPELLAFNAEYFLPCRSLRDVIETAGFNFGISAPSVPFVMLEREGRFYCNDGIDAETGEEWSAIPEGAEWVTLKILRARLRAAKKGA